MPAVDPPVLDGIHHLKLPVTDLARSLEWYRRRLGYQDQVEFVEQGTLLGCSMAHPAGGPHLGLRLDPDRARAAAGFDYFAIGVPDKAAIDDLARRLDELGQPHAGVHRASLGWILPEVPDPDGHALRFYTMEHHTDVASGEVTTIRGKPPSGSNARKPAARSAAPHSRGTRPGRPWRSTRASRTSRGSTTTCSRQGQLCRGPGSGRAGDADQPVRGAHRPGQPGVP